jgi:hypothetical protein
MGPTNPPTLSDFNSTGIYQFAFAGISTDNDIHCSLRPPYDWKQGTSIIPCFNWAPSDTGSGDVKWAIDYTTADPGGTYSGTVTTISQIASTNTTAFEHIHTTFSTGITLTGKGRNVSMLMKVYRNASDTVNDTYGSSAFLNNIQFCYEIDKLGGSYTAS